MREIDTPAGFVRIPPEILVVRGESAVGVVGEFAFCRREAVDLLFDRLRDLHTVYGVDNRSGVTREHESRRSNLRDAVGGERDERVRIECRPDRLVPLSEVGTVLLLEECRTYVPHRRILVAQARVAVREHRREDDVLLVGEVDAPTRFVRVPPQRRVIRRSSGGRCDLRVGGETTTQCERHENRGEQFAEDVHGKPFCPIRTKILKDLIQKAGS